MLTRRTLIALAGAAGATGVVGLPAARAVVAGTPAVTTRCYNTARSGANLQETTLTAANVRQQGVALKYTLQMSGDARGSEAQTLIMPNMTMADGLSHDLAIQASMSGAVFTFDANSGELLWMRDYCDPVVGTPAFDIYMINQNWGILGTPVIDPATNIMYFVSWSSTDGTSATARYIAHAVNIVDGSDAAASVDLTGTTYSPGHGLATMQLGTIPRKQRTGLLLTSVNGAKVIIVAFAAGAESAATNHGWVIALSTSPFRVTAGWNDSPHWQGGGIWMGAQAPAADANGNIYLIGSNGSFDGVTDFCESFIKLQYTPPANTTSLGSLTCIDWWTPFTDSGRAGENPTTPWYDATTADKALANRPANKMITMPPVVPPAGSAPPRKAAAMKNAANSEASNAQWTDQDLGSAGTLLIPEFNLLAGAGKDGILYVLNANDLGKTQLSDFGSAAGINANYAKAKSINWFTYFPGYNVSPTPTNFTQLNFFYNNQTHHQHSTPVYYHSGKNGPMLFTCGENGPVRVWGINAQGQLNFLAYSDEYASPNAPTPYGGMPGAMLTLSANGSTVGSALLIACFPLGNANSSVTGGFFVVYDADNFVARGDGSQKLNPLWRSEDWGITYDHNKFNVPVVAGGKIFIPTYDDKVMVFALT